MKPADTNLEDRLRGYYKDRYSKVREPQQFWEEIAPHINGEGAETTSAARLVRFPGAPAAGGTERRNAMEPYVEQQTASGAAKRNRNLSMGWAAMLLLGLGAVLVIAYTALSGIFPLPLTTNEPRPTATPIAELYSNGFEDTALMWEGSSVIGYQAGLDHTVVYEGKASGYIKSVAPDPEPRAFMPISAYLSADAYRGKRLRYSAYVKSENLEQWAGLWMRVDVKRDASMPYATSVDFDNMSDRPILGTSDWKKYDIVLNVPQDAQTIYFGLLLSGKGQVWIDEARIEEVGPDVPVTGLSVRDKPCNLTFEEESLCWSISANSAHLYQGGVDRSTSHTGKASGFLKSEKSDTRDSAGVVQMFYADEYRGKRVRYSAYVKTENVQERAGLRMSIQGWSRSERLWVNDDMKERPIKGTTDWQKYEIVLDVPDESVTISIGLVLNGSGQAWIDDAQIEAVGTDVPVTSKGTSTP